MANSIVFIVMVTHQQVYTPPVHLQGKVLQGTHNVAELSAIAHFANPLMAYFPNFFILAGLLQDLKTACFFYCMSQKYSFLAHVVQTHLQRLKTAIALPKPK